MLFGEHALQKSRADPAKIIYNNRYRQNGREWVNQTSHLVNKDLNEPVNNNESASVGLERNNSPPSYINCDVIPETFVRPKRNVEKPVRLSDYIVMLKQFEL